MNKPAAESGLVERFLTLHEIVRAARTNLSDNVWDYIVGGADTETTLKRNRLAIDSLAFRPRVLRDVSSIDTAADVLGKPARLPVVLAPVGSLESFDAGGAATVARAAARFGVPQIVSSAAEPGLEKTAEAAASCRRIFQLYVRGDEAWVDDFGRRAIAAGYEAFCFTVDTAIYSRRERDLAKRYVTTGRRRVTPQNQTFQAALSWKEIERFRARHKIPLMLKGIATAEDAELACKAGIDCIYVSNHGGRQLDQGRGAIAVLPEVVAAVKGRAQIVVDGGFCRGTDIVKALALGANAVGIGRLYCYGLAAAGEAGVLRVLELLETEVRLAMGLLGVKSYAELSPAMLVPAPTVVSPHVLSAFPLLDLSHPGY